MLKRRHEDAFHAEEPVDTKPAGLRSRAREDDLALTRSEGAREPCARCLKIPAGFAAQSMRARGICPSMLARLRHRAEHLGVRDGDRVMIEIDHRYGPAAKLILMREPRNSCPPIERPAALSIWISPPCASAMRRA